jgi:photosystem II stability/assembly factor-like uncharacterized protein
MNRFFLFALSFIVVTSCRSHLDEPTSPAIPCVFQFNLPDTVGSWHIDTFPLPKNDRYNQDIFFLNNRVGFLLKDYYSLFKTKDGGTTWTQINSFKDPEITDKAYFINENVGFVSVFGRPNARLLVTTDGGLSWENRIYPFLGSIKNIHFIDSLNGLALSSAFENNNLTISLIQTKNQGKTWEKVALTDSLSADYGFILQFLDDKKLFATAQKNNQEYLIKSIDGGLIWKALGNIPKFTTAIKFLDEQNGFLTTISHCYTTVDGGLTWQEKTDIIGFPKLLYINNLDDVLLSLETIQCSHGDYADYQAEFLSLENKFILGSKKVTNLRLRTSFFVSNKLGFVVSGDKLLRFTR